MKDVAAAPLSGDLDAIAHELGNPHLLATPIAIEVGGLRQLIAKTDALATAVRDLLDEVRTEGGQSPPGRTPRAPRGRNGHRSAKVTRRDRPTKAARSGAPLRC